MYRPTPTRVKDHHWCPLEQVPPLPRHGRVTPTKSEESRSRSRPRRVQWWEGRWDRARPLFQVGGGFRDRMGRGAVVGSEAGGTRSVPVEGYLEESKGLGT